MAEEEPTRSLGGGVTLKRNPHPTPTEAPWAKGFPCPPTLRCCEAMCRALIGATLLDSDPSPWASHLTSVPGFLGLENGTVFYILRGSFDG